ncbi:serine hydrolase [Rheinheimera sp. SA_1]|uniref:serine hydrolase domain-containing protein n=1 Tax=Rheinheimera sp. SA_1 TaxID=1827365 RepID=UPI0007FE85A1|nr:serine hydrolase domain-containing protein [Rheinheimera sp. SA_1]OBP15555.1 serine hydrolase [Rheinheimera sp. SA_1]
MLRLTMLASLLWWSASAAAAPSINEFANEFHQEFSRKMAKNKIPGGVYVIVKDDKIVRVGAYGVRSRSAKAKIDANTVFRLASVSKTFAGGLAAQVAHEGRFSFQDKVTKYVPGFKFRSPNMTSQLKIEHLLAQNSGVSPNAFDDLIEANMTPAQILPKFGNINPRCQPGKCYGYQNVLFSLIETVLLKTTNTPYERLIEQRIFKPLQMHNASVGYSAFLASKNRAMPHVKIRSGWGEAKVVPTYYRVNPAAGVNASAMDMGKWLIARLGHQPTVQSPAVLQDIHKPRVKTSDNLSGRTFGPYVTQAHYGLGTRIYQFGKHKLYYHGGLVRGYRTDLSYSSEKGLGLVVLLNAQSNLVAELSSYFWATMLDTQPQVTPPAKRKKKVRKVAQQLEPLFTPDELDESAPWLVPMQLPVVDDSQLALWSAEDWEQSAP